MPRSSSVMREEAKAAFQSQEIVKHEPASPAHLLELAINSNLDVEKLKELMQLQKQWQADQARKAFFSAMNDFQSKVPEIRKGKKVSFGKDSKTEYHYAPLAEITRQIKDTCQECGLSYRWEIKDTKEDIQVTCLITHIDGHTEQTTMMSNPDLTGSKNPIQARGSAIEYLKRYTLIGALGLSTADSDVDGQQPEIDLDILHSQFMKHYNQLVQLDSSYTKIHPDNWKMAPSQKGYIKAIAEVRQLLIDKTPKPI